MAKPNLRIVEQPLDYAIPPEAHDRAASFGDGWFLIWGTAAALVWLGVLFEAGAL